VQQLTRFQLTSASRGPSAEAEAEPGVLSVAHLRTISSPALVELSSPTLDYSGGVENVGPENDRPGGAEE